MPPATVKVWDPFIRVFHWSLVTLFIVAYATGNEIERVHVIAGYTIAGLVGLRIVWGFIGPQHARFVNFVRPPREVFAYLRDIIGMKAQRYIGHNPAGGAMILALLGMLTGICITGFMLTTDAYWGVKWVKELHEAFVNVTVGLIALHVIGVIAASFEHRENLVRAMITGRKPAIGPKQPGS